MKALTDRNPALRQRAGWPLPPVVGPSFPTSLAAAAAAAAAAAFFAVIVGSPSPALAQDEEDVFLVEANAEWKYNDSGANLGTAWIEPNYDDSGWKSGQAPLGYGDSGMGTEISSGDSSDKIITQYFRKEFFAESPGQYFSMIVRVQRDDGVAVYINGTRILVDNLPAEFDYQTQAIASIDGSNERAWVETAKTTAALEAGLNVIAVEVHQSSPTSSDTRMDAQVIISKVQPEYGEVRIGIQTKFTEGGWGRDFFERNILADPPEIEMNWTSRASGAQFALTTDREIVGDVTDIIDENGDLDIQFFIWNATLNEWESEKVDTRNYNNVQVKVDVRTRDERNGFETSDYFRGEIDISTNGKKFDTLDWFELKGGGDKPIEWKEVINADTTKKVKVPSSAADPGANWMDAGFDDSSWTSGVLGIGYETGSGYEDLIGIDMIDTMRSVNGTCYIRIPFNVTNVAQYSEMQFRVRYDDGYVAFINGREISRKNAPTPLAWNSEATSTNSDLRAVIYEDVNVKEALGLANLTTVLKEGQNILTIVGLNTPVGSSDFLNDVVLRLGKPGEGIPVSLDALNYGPENRLTTYVSEVGLVPNSTASMQVRFEGRVNDDLGEVVYFDNIRTTGDPIAADSYYAYMQLETGWDLEDPRIQPHADPDGDSIQNLLEYAFGSPPQIAGQTIIVRGEEVPILPQWDIKRFAFANVSYRQISAPLAKDGDNAATEGFHVQDLLYVAQISRGEIDARGEWIWSDGTAGGETVFEQRVAFEENEDGTVQVKLHGLRGLSADKTTYCRLLLRIVGFEQINN